MFFISIFIFNSDKIGQENKDNAIKIISIKNNNRDEA